MSKDSKGFLWMGTSSGLSRYDGYNFQNHPYSKDKELMGYVNVIKQDASQRLWIGTGAGLFCYVNNEIIKLSSATAAPQGVNDILIEKNGTIWLATENGPSKFEIKDVDLTGRNKIVLTNYLLGQWKPKDETIDERRTTLIAKSPDNTVYIAQHKKLFRLLDNKIELIHSTEGIDKINALFPISKSKIYFDGASTEINRFENGINTVIPLKEFYIPDQKNNSPGEWYVGTRGAFFFHPQSGIATSLITFPGKYVVWTTSVLQDDGFIWISSHDGLIKAKPSIFTEYAANPVLHYSDYYSITELRNGKLLFGGNFGKLLEKNGDALLLIKDKLVPSAEMKDLYEDENGWLWIASGYQGIVVLRNNNIERITVENGLHDNSLYQFLKTNNGKLFVFGDQGASEIIVDQTQQISFKKFLYQPNISQYGKFFSGTDAPDGTIWMGGEEGIFYIKNDSIHRFTFNGKQFLINFLTRDKEGKVWIATSGEGILQCVFNTNNELEIVQQYTESDGLNSLHYLNLLVDKDNNIWAGSSKGISVIGRKGRYKDRVLNFDESDGFIRAGYSSIKLRQVTDGNIWVATTFGITSFHPDQLNISDTPPLVYLTGIRQVEENDLIADSTFNQPAEKNKFGYAYNSFHFNFTAIDYANQENMRYYYKLEGRDSAWKNSGSLRSISFENLSPGKYFFHVKALNSKSVWSKQDAIYSFTITPPFWKTWWFPALVLITISVLAIWAARRRIFFIKRREAQKTALQQLKATSYREQLEIEQIINHFATSMNNINSIDEILWDVAKKCISRLKFEDCVIYLKDEKTNLLIQKAAWGPKTTEENKIIKPINLSPGVGIVGSVALSGKAEIVNDTALDERYIVDDINRSSEITVPIINNGELLGIIDSEHSERNFYTQRHLQVLTTIASLCAGKIITLKAEQQIREKEMEVLRLNKDFATSQLTTLRMQMNPHFIFNALNSVQHYILQGNVIEANKYLSKFSKLQREILHCSNLQFITLEKEIEILNGYLQLEQNRFGESFNYQINMTDEIEPVEIKIPPMVLQPFVENAIWHGLMPRQTERVLSIFFDLPSDDILQATLRDNGIGRAASAKLKQTNGGIKTGHESKGMSMVQQRLHLLQQQYDKPFEATISDITDINGEVQGTQVTVRIFIGNKNL